VEAYTTVKRLLLLFLLICSSVSYVYAGTITMPQYNTGDTATASNLNQRWNLNTNVLNGGLDNANADVSGGFRFIEVLEALPAAGNQGRVVFLTDNNTLNFDTGFSFLATALLANTQTFTGSNIFEGTTTINTLVSGSVNIDGGNIDSTAIGADTAAAGTFTALEATSTFKLVTTNQGDILFDNGTSIIRLVPGTDNRLLQTQGSGANPQWVSGVHLVSFNETSSAATATGDLTITSDKPHLFSFEILISADTDTSIVFSFCFL